MSLAYCATTFARVQEPLLPNGLTESGHGHPSESRDVDVSVVIPTYERRLRLRRVLEALDEQDTVTEERQPFRFEVIVVSDGSADGTAEMVRSMSMSYPLSVIEQENAGPASARNRGIAAASAPTILFLDDDVIPERECLRAHVQLHSRRQDCVAIGPMLTPADVRLTPWVAWEQHQLEKQYRWFESNRTISDRNFYTGNASVSRAALTAVGGFDTAFRRAEDLELAHRLALHGQTFAFVGEARAFHYADRSFESWIRTAYDYGSHTITFARRGQTELIETTRRQFEQRHALQRLLVRALIERPEASVVAERLIARSVVAADRFRLAVVARLLLSGLFGLKFYRGVADGLGGPREFVKMLAGRQDEDLRAVFVLEQTLGHVTHSRNLRSRLSHVDGLRPVFLPVEPALSGVWRFVPGWTNWTIRAGVRARRMLRALPRTTRDGMDVMFVHSQVPAVLLGRWMRRTPTVVSLDATPRQFDILGASYAHGVSRPAVERVKTWANRRCFVRAQHLVAWSEWAKNGLVADYGVSPDDVTVIAPGVDLELWSRPANPDEGGPTIRLLFVGGDLHRKGGDLLLEASRLLRHEPGVPPFELHLVTSADLDEEPGLIVHRGLTANCPQLIELYHRADIFCLPTLGDCLPMVLAEAGAAGLPLISTDVGAIGEIVRDGETGRLVTAGDLRHLVTAMRELLMSPDERERCGRQARALVERMHDATVNSAHLAAVLWRVSGRGRPALEGCDSAPEPDRPVASSPVSPGLDGPATRGSRLHLDESADPDNLSTGIET